MPCRIRIYDVPALNMGMPHQIVRKFSLVASAISMTDGGPSAFLPEKSGMTPTGAINCVFCGGTLPEMPEECPNCEEPMLPEAVARQLVFKSVRGRR